MDSPIKDFTLFRSPASPQFRLAFGNLEPLLVDQIQEEVWVVQPYLGGGFYQLPVVEQATVMSEVLALNVNLISAEVNNRRLAAGQDDSTIYKLAVENAILSIRAGQMQKVVLARTKLGILDENLTVGQLATQLAGRYPNAYLTISYSAKFGFWVGASPELLLRSTGLRHFESLSIAGTRAADTLGDWGTKELAEQDIVTKYIAKQLAEIGGYDLNIEAGTSTSFGPIAHLSNIMRWTLKLNGVEDLVPVLASLHPTPAVVGEPKVAAAQYINQNEGFERGLYVGLWGTVKRSSVEIYVNLRCAEVLGQTIKAYAGAGIIADSLAEAEWQETEAKADAILNAFALHSNA